jgi:hypothetical protein
MVQKTNDADKLEMNKEQFIGKPLKVLLEQIEPKIKLVYGNPENTWAGAIGGTYLKFHFVDGDEWREIHKKNQKPIGITVSFQLEPNNTRKPLPKEGLKEWKSEDTMEYGDMIILNVRVSGEK